MSRIGKKTIEIPQAVEVTLKDNQVFFKGPKGELSQSINGEILVKQEDNKLIVEVKQKTKKSSAFWGLSRALLQNCLDGVTNGFEKKLEIIGVGYKAVLEGDKAINLSVGFSHLVKLEIPEGIKVLVEKNIITVSGINKQAVGQFAAKIRAVRKPEPYKGKGIRYLGEKVRRKEGKKTAGAA